MASKKILVSKASSTLSPQSETALRARLAACQTVGVLSVVNGDATASDVKPGSRTNGKEKANVAKKSDNSGEGVPVVPKVIKKNAAAAHKRVVAPAKGKPAKRKHVLPDKMPTGLIFKDLTKKFWKLGDVIGEGGFGYLYAVEQHNVEGAAKKDTQKYVLKVEPHDNGPLFTELHFYQNVGKPDMVTEWVTKRRLDYLGIPRYHGHGPQEFQNKKYRFMVIDRCGKDLQKIFEEGDEPFVLKDVVLLASQVLHILHYIHAHEYVHADIKGSNLLLELGAAPHQHVYLVDFGLASRYTVDGTHRAYKKDPKRCHDGTPEFTSRDAHQGYHPSRRGDLEILAYCMLYWLSGGALPWIDALDRLEEVSRQKTHYMDNVDELLDACDLEGSARVLMNKFLDYVRTMKYDDEPDYKLLQNTLKKCMKDVKGNMSDAFSFNISANDRKAVQQGKKRTKKT